MMIYRKLTAALLTLAMTLTILSACGGTEGNNPSAGPSGNGDPVSAAPIVLENAYIATDIPVENANSYGRADIVVANDHIYYMSTENLTTTDDDGTSTDTGYITRINSAGLDGGNVETIWEKEFAYPDQTADVMEYENLYTFAVDNSGNLWTFFAYDKYEKKAERSETKMMLIKYAPDGTEIVASDISGIAGENEYFYPNGVYFSGEGDLCVLSYQAIYVFDGETGEFDFKIAEQNYIQGITMTNTGDVIYITQPQMEFEIKTIDFAAKKAGEVKTYSGNIYFNAIAGGYGDYSFYAMQNDYIYGFKLDTMTPEVVVNFTNSDIDSSYVSRIVSMPNGDFITSSYNWDNKESSVMRLTPNPNPVIEGKVLITLGAVYVDPSTRSAVRQFNKSSTTTRINIVDYSQYNTNENYSAGMTQLDMDILSGKAPDIICFSSLQPAKYAAKGILEDLQPYLENDSSIKIEDLFQNILDAGTYDGKLCRLITGYSISTLAGKKSIVGETGSFTAAKVNQIAAQHPDSEIVLMTSASNWLTNCISMALDEYIDWATGECTFNTPEFIELLNSSTHFPAEIDYDSIYEDYNAYEENLKTTFKEDRTILMNCGMSRIRELRSTKETFGEEVSYVGYPTKNGGGALIYPYQDYGISAASKLKDEAWSFISMFLNGKVDSENRWSQSISRLSYEKLAKDEMTPIAERDFSKGVEIIEFYPGGGASIGTYNSKSEINLNDYIGYELTQEEVDIGRKIIESATRVYASDETISKIITEELDAFISGAKSAQDVAQVIQSRVSIYVSEIM